MYLLSDDQTVHNIVMLVHNPRDLVMLWLSNCH